VNRELYSEVITARINYIKITWSFFYCLS